MSSSSPSSNESFVFVHVKVVFSLLSLAFSLFQRQMMWLQETASLRLRLKANVHPGTICQRRGSFPPVVCMTELWPWWLPGIDYWKELGIVQPSRRNSAVLSLWSTIMSTLSPLLLQPVVPIISRGLVKSMNNWSYWLSLMAFGLGDGQVWLQPI